MKRRLKCEFDQVDEDVLSFVLSQCNNDESAASKALRTQVTNLISKEYTSGSCDNSDVKDASNAGARGVCLH